MRCSGVRSSRSAQLLLLGTAAALVSFSVAAQRIGAASRVLGQPLGSLDDDHDVSSDGADDKGYGALEICVLVVLLALSGLFSGLGLGLMSLDLIGLEIVVAAGTDEHATAKEKRQGESARKIIPIREKGNLLLTTLLMGNVAVNSLTSIMMADMTSGLAGFLVSTALIVIFGEIVPQAICTKHALEIGGRVIPFVKLLIALFYVFAKPVSMVLDASLGEDIGTVFTKRQLTQMIEIHEQQSMIDPEEGGILRGAMSYRVKTAKSIMTPVKDLFMLPITAELDIDTMQRIMDSGYSRIPVYGASPDDIVGTVHVKDLIFVDPKEQVQLSTFMHVFGHNVNYVDPDCSLDVLLEAFKRESTHLALVKTVERDEDTDADPIERLKGIVTLEDLLEEILQDEILDEADVADSTEDAERKRRLSCLYRRGGRLTQADFVSADQTVENVEALARHLQDTNPIFRSKNARGVAINTTLLADFLANCPILEFSGSGSSKPEEVFSRDVVTHCCAVVLDGKLRVESTGGRVEVGPWAVLAADSLVVQEGLYRADVTVRSVPGVRTRVLRIARADFQQRLHPFARRSSAPSSSGV